MTDDTTINFQLDLGKGQSGGSLTYRPWGTRTLKIKVSTSRDMPALRVRPRNMRSEDKEAGTFRGFADDSDALMVSWGGGHEDGPCVKPKDSLAIFEKPASLVAGEQSYVYFNITHLDSCAPPSSATLTIEAYHPKTSAVSEYIEATVTVQLVCPDDLPGDVIQINPTNNAYDRWEMSGGSYLPRYDPRWWPETVTFEFVSPPPLVITRLNNELRLFWDDQPDPIAIISDNTKPSILVPQNIKEDTNTVKFELFSFDEWHIALRIWLFWFNKRIGQTLIFVGRHEVPDAERFDLIIRKDSGQVILACTDLHWSEMWGEVIQMPLEARLGLSLKVIMDGIKAKAKEVAEQLGIGKHEAADEVNMSRNPITFIRRLAKTRYQKEHTGRVRAKGTQAHIPQLLSPIEYYSNQYTGRNLMISNDVRLVLD